MIILGIFDHLMSGEFWQHWLWAFLFGLLGLLLGWLFWGRFIKGLRAEVADLKTQIEDWRKKYAKLQDENAALEADLKDARADIEKKSVRIRNLELEKGQLHGDLMAARQVRDANTKELEGLRLQIEEAGGVAAYGSSSGGGSAGANTAGEVKELQGRIKDLENADVKSVAEIKELKAKLAEVEANANRHVRTISGLEADLAECKASKGNASAAAGAGIVAGAAGTSDRKMSKEEKAALATKAKDNVKAAMGSKIKTASAGDKDDLKLISGVGPAIEKKLNGLGIYTFEQVSQFDADLVQQVNDAIEFFPGRIQRDDWVGQAGKLHQTKMTNPDALKKDKNPSNPEDLKIVEGIGPKIEQLLKNAGVKTWSNLAATPVSKLKEVLDAAGDRYRIHDPETWPDQAKLAANGEWDKLKEYQDFLQGGRTK